mmetsp:Transcript_70550/g.147744  ORF Transcript_70550/g.147744 Transcript_70550/m.147744 type:complete len:360 (-) Transcript_70550:270-1349(-)|eukprot:CAMPEP_0206572530 /NCGR_PEP_ID=MMETSP0325_2-20121206/28309_1 /ASSEMBLY_ACC=CAM_ASM_000347 /TAXON_ID=2866 /ORGANISM="Crypthecodinium cohnii, Strain Seligo" /LENGTH=359 /DNA_ID=CAMNT_0054076769 /DNA_START=1 /DNA_END=1080 /DNA_ORIENTATION=-
MWFRKVWRFMQAHPSAAVSACAGAGSAGITIGALAWNATETHRMASSIEKRRFVPRIRQNVRPELSPLNLDGILSSLKEYNLISIVGYKALGKSTTVELVLGKAKNPFYLNLSTPDLIEPIYAQLHGSVLHLPFPLDSVRFNSDQTHQNIVNEVFNLVKQRTHQEVVLGLDIRPPDGSQGKPFVRALKEFCCDAELASAVFATSEGAMILGVIEPRMEVHVARELSLEKAQEFLKHFYPGVQYSADMLERFPRTFATLKRFANATDKEAFCKDHVKASTVPIFNALDHFPKAKKLFHVALKRGIVERRDLAGIFASDTQFDDFFIKPNIFRPLPGGGWELHFDCTRLAVKAVLATLPWW